MTLSVKKKIYRIGGSLAVIIPPIWIKSNHIKPKDELEIRVFDDHLEIRPVKEVAAS